MRVGSGFGNFIRWWACSTGPFCYAQYTYVKETCFPPSSELAGDCTCSRKRGNRPPTSSILIGARCSAAVDRRRFSDSKEHARCTPVFFRLPPLPVHMLPSLPAYCSVQSSQSSALTNPPQRQATSRPPSNPAGTGALVSGCLIVEAPRRTPSPFSNLRVPYLSVFLPSPSRPL